MICKEILIIDYITNSIFSSRTYWFTEKDSNLFWLVDCGDLDHVFHHLPENVVVVGEGERIELFEGVFADVYYTPGHDESCLCYEIGEDMFTGDAYIPGVKTVTTFPHSSKKKALESDLRISSLVRGMKVWPGHTVLVDRK